MDDPDLRMVVKRLDAILTCPNCKKVNFEQSIYIWNKEGTPFQYKGCDFGHSLALDESKVKEILTNFPKTCAYTSSGCNLISVLKRHEPFRDFLRCLVGEDNNYCGCKWKGTFKDWQEHVDSVHPSYVVEYSANVEKKVSINLNDFVSVRRHHYLHKVDGNLFIVSVRLLVDHLEFYVRKVSLKKTSRTHYLSVIFRDKCDFVLCRVSIKSIIEDGPLEDAHSAFVPTEELKGIQDDEGAVDVTFVMTSKTEELQNKGIVLLAII